MAKSTVYFCRVTATIPVEGNEQERAITFRVHDDSGSLYVFPDGQYHLFIGIDQDLKMRKVEKRIHGIPLLEFYHRPTSEQIYENEFKLNIDAMNNVEVRQGSRYVYLERYGDCDIAINPTRIVLATMSLLGVKVPSLQEDESQANLGMD
ncbi:MAG: hypothetical protein Q7R86_02655 [bacterium]|nr:hypothetical protein [bacterium]